MTDEKKDPCIVCPLRGDLKKCLDAGCELHGSWLVETLAANLDFFAERIEELERRRALYDQLIFAVGKKYPDETRHETALRYIRKMEVAVESVPVKMDNA